MLGTPRVPSIQLVSPQSSLPIRTWVVAPSGKGSQTLTSKHSSHCVATASLSSPKVKRVIVTPAVYPRLVKSLCIGIQSTGQKSLCVNIHLEPSQSFVLIRQSDSPKQ